MIKLPLRVQNGAYTPQVRRVSSSANQRVPLSQKQAGNSLRCNPRLIRLKNVCYSYFECIKGRFRGNRFKNVDENVKKFAATHDLKAFISPENLLGSGANAYVYRIPNTEYALRIRNPKYVTSKICPTIMERCKINFRLARLENNSGHIVKYVEGLAIKDYIYRKGKVDADTIAKITDTIDNLSSDKIKNYYMKLVEAKRYGLGHDYFGNNCIVNLKSKDITPIDFDLGRPASFYESLIISCSDATLLNAQQQNNLFKKGLKSLLELVREGKILKSEVHLPNDSFVDHIDSYYIGFVKDRAYFTHIMELCKTFNADKSMKNINRIIAELS